MPAPYAWTVDAEAVVLVPALAVVYLAGRQIVPSRRWRPVAFTLGLGLVLAVFVTPLESLALHYLLTAHLLQNVVLAEWAPALLLLGLAPEAAARLAESRVLRNLTRPVVALPLWLVTYYVWHLPAAYDAALRNPGSLLHLEHLCYLVTGALMWWPVIHDSPHRLGSGAKAAYLFAAFVLASPLGLILALLPKAVYDTYIHAPGRVWGLSANSDQRFAGLTMAVEEAIVFFVVCAHYMRRFLSEQESGEELRAYSATSSSRADRSS